MRTLSEIALLTHQQAIATCTSCCSACNYSFANKTDILHEEKKTVDIKLQYRISKKNSFSRYLENAMSRNILM